MTWGADMAGTASSQKNKDNKDLEPVLKKLQSRLMECLYGEDRSWIQAGELRGVRAPEYTEKADYGFSNQRGLHWPVTAPPAR